MQCAIRFPDRATLGGTPEPRTNVIRIDIDESVNAAGAERMPTMGVVGEHPWRSSVSAGVEDGRRRSLACARPRTPQDSS